MIKLHELNTIDNNMLKHAIGIKFYNNYEYKKIAGTISKFFDCNKLYTLTLCLNT